MHFIEHLRSQLHLKLSKYSINLTKYMPAIDQFLVLKMNRQPLYENRSSDEQTNNDISSTVLENSRTISHRSEMAATERDSIHTPHVNNQDRYNTTAEGNHIFSPSSLNPKVSSNVMIVNESVPLMNCRDNRSVGKLSEQQSDTQRKNMETGIKPTKSYTPSGDDGNETKNLPVKPEKKQKSGFLSRISGFRFSLRGKKKAKVFENNNPVINENRVTSSDNKREKNEKIEKVDNSHSSINKNGEFVFIPLKEPLSGSPIRNVDSCVKSKQTSDVVDNSHVLTAKPPLPRQPPRVVGVCAKPPLPNTNGKIRHVHAQQRASSAPREIDVNDHNLTSDHEFCNQFYCDTMTNAGDDSGLCDDDRFNESVGFEHKIGLIETNLDTHETVISGKTRSLMELGPQIDSQRKQCSAKHRIAMTMEPHTRRPHKSMEFLLDKENQKIVLPCHLTIQIQSSNVVSKQEERGLCLTENRSVRVGKNIENREMSSKRQMDK
ncbi:hypothetical protein Bhyg_00561 [Pseudolycoriella hygida]|uniref:Uncharacterized protein n=1 Tax=Pseudolycoriella hygida TaxID=35572 RepID=A0A9Q0N7R1_9DIPT|nr:hypothetical protein Bhyg_00561 [Pseudolycoriella hygida]